MAVFTRTMDLLLSVPEAPERPIEARSAEARSAGTVRQLVDRYRWMAPTAVVGMTSWFVGFLGLWAGSYIVKSSISGAALRWDSDWYYRISQTGYPNRVATSATDTEGLRTAFFPGLPIVENLVHRVVGGSPDHTTFVVGFLALVVSCVILRALVAFDFGEEVARRVVVMFAFFPGAYVFVLGYSEALAIPLAMFTLYALRRRWLVVAGLVAGLAATTRLLGAALVISCLVGAVRELRGDDVRRPGRVVAAVASPVLALWGIAAYLLYLKVHTGHAMAFETAERIGWNNTASLLAPLSALRAFVDSPFTTPADTVNALGVVALCAGLFFLGVSRLRLEDKAFAAAILLVWLFTTNAGIGAWFRFVELAFPLVVATAVRIPSARQPPLVAFFAGGLGILVVLFATVVAFSP